MNTSLLVPGLAYYRDLIQKLKENNIEPLVTMHHWDNPRIIEDEGGFLNEVCIFVAISFAQRSNFYLRQPKNPKNQLDCLKIGLFKAELIWFRKSKFLALFRKFTEPKGSSLFNNREKIGHFKAKLIWDANTLILCEVNQITRS